MCWPVASRLDSQNAGAVPCTGGCGGSMLGEASEDTDLTKRVARPGSGFSFRCVEILDEAWGGLYTRFPAGQTGGPDRDERDGNRRSHAARRLATRRSSSPGDGVSDFRPVGMQGGLRALRAIERQHLNKWSAERRSRLVSRGNPERDGRGTSGCRDVVRQRRSSDLDRWGDPWARLRNLDRSGRGVP